MTEKDDLLRYLTEGFTPLMILRVVDDDEIRRRGMPETFIGKTVRPLPLSHADGRSLRLFLKDPEAIAYAEELVADLLTVVGYALEELFGSKPEDMLSKEELQGVQLAISELDWIDPEKRGALIERLANSDLIAKESRNVRIARAVSSLLKEDCEQVYSQIRELTTARGKRVHSLSVHDETLTQHIVFAERILLAYIGSRSQYTDS